MVPIGDAISYEITVSNAADSVSGAEPDTIDIQDTLPAPPPNYSFTVRPQDGWKCTPQGGSAGGNVKAKPIKCSYTKGLGKGATSSKIFIEVKPNAGPANKVGDTYKYTAGIVSSGRGQQCGQGDHGGGHRDDREAVTRPPHGFLTVTTAETPNRPEQLPRASRARGAGIRTRLTGAATHNGFQDRRI